MNQPKPLEDYAMNALVNASANQPVTMSSLELVEFINSQRKESEAILSHADFMKKVPKVLGGGEGKFSDTYVHPQNGQTYPCYVFPKREACLMAMSYSYDLQAVVYDRMTELENRQVLPTNYIEALEHLLIAKKSEQQAIAERDHAIATKAQIGSKREATAMATASAASRKVVELQAELGRCKSHATIIAVQNVTGESYKWQPLKKWCKERGLKPIEVVDPRWGVVKSWPAQAWLDVHAVDINMEF